MNDRSPKTQRNELTADMVSVHVLCVHVQPATVFRQIQPNARIAQTHTHATCTRAPAHAVYTCTSAERNWTNDDLTHFVCTQIVWQFRRSITQTEYKIWLMDRFGRKMNSHVTVVAPYIWNCEGKRTFFLFRFASLGREEVEEVH